MLCCKACRASSKPHWLWKTMVSWGVSQHQESNADTLAAKLISFTAQKGTQIHVQGHTHTVSKATLITAHTPEGCWTLFHYASMIFLAFWFCQGWERMWLCSINVSRGKKQGAIPWVLRFSQRTKLSQANSDKKFFSLRGAFPSQQWGKKMPASVRWASLLSRTTFLWSCLFYQKTVLSDWGDLDSSFLTSLLRYF